MTTEEQQKSCVQQIEAVEILPGRYRIPECFCDLDTEAVRKDLMEKALLRLEAHESRIRRLSDSRDSELADLERRFSIAHYYRCYLPSYMVTEGIVGYRFPVRELRDERDKSILDGLMLQLGESRIKDVIAPETMRKYRKEVIARYDPEIVKLCEEREEMIRKPFLPEEVCLIEAMTTLEEYKMGGKKMDETGTGAIIKEAFEALSREYSARSS